MRTYTISLATLATLAAGILASPALATSGSCAFKKSEITAANSVDQSTSTSWTNVGASGSVQFVTSGTGCIAGTFSAVAYNANANDSVRLQVLLDGNTCDPLTGNYGFGGGTPFGSESAEYICGANIPAGSHTIQVQYHSGNGGNAEIYQRALVVNHR